MLGQLCVYREASELASELLNVEVSDQQIRRVCIHYGQVIDKIVDANIEAMIPKIVSTKPQDPTYLMMDGSMLYTRDYGWK
jgi:hypothetical protein